MKFYVVNMDQVHEQLLQTDTLQPEDRSLLRDIVEAARAQEPVDCAGLIREYYRDADRADRTPRGLLYMHIGWLCGAIGVEP
jgi:hypothetical protein